MIVKLKGGRDLPSVVWYAGAFENNASKQVHVRLGSDYLILSYATSQAI